MSGKVHFHLSDHVNKHNAWYCLQEDPWTCVGLCAISLTVMVTV
jgi:hypothetical protein